MVDQVALGREFFEMLEAHDEAITGRVAAGGCPVCDGPLYRGDYDRKPRGGLIARTGEEFVRRFSLCCGREGCRKRATPPSLRFLGPKVYLATIVVLVSIMRHGASPKRVQRMNEAVGVDRRTVERWRRWWRDKFTATPFWQIARAAFMPPVEHDRLPASLLDRFGDDSADAVVALLRFLAPITGGRSHAR